MSKIKLLSLIIPVYKQEKTIVRDVKALVKALSEISYKYEIIIVVDGRIDKTFEKAKSVKSNNIKLLGYEKKLGERIRC